MSIEESELVFQFPDNWIVKKYDTHRLYRAMSSAGMSAVDFVCLIDGVQVVFIEVKNFRNRPVRELARTTSKLEGNPPLLAEVFHEKVEETKLCIRAMHSYRKRYAWWRFWQRFLQQSILRKWLLRSDRLFWIQIARRVAAAPDQLQLVLWLELPDTLESYRMPLHQAIDTLFQTTQHQTQLAQTKQNPLQGVRVAFEMATSAS